MFPLNAAAVNSSFSLLTFCSKNTLPPPSAQRKSRPSTLSSTRFRLSAHSWRRSCPGPGTWPWCWKGRLKGSLTLEVGRGRERPPGLRGALSLSRSDFLLLLLLLSEHSTVESHWHSGCEMKLSVALMVSFIQNKQVDLIRKVVLKHKQIQTDQPVGLQAASQALLRVAEACLDEPLWYEVDTVQPNLIYAYICGCGVNLFLHCL